MGNVGQVCCWMELAMSNDDKLSQTIQNEERKHLVSNNALKRPDISNINVNNSISKSTTADMSTSSQNMEHDHDTLLEDFEESIINKDFDNAMALLEEFENIDFMNHEFANGDKALHYGIRQKNSRFAYFILQKGADPNCISRKTGDTPLHIATRNEDIRMITLLMKWKAGTEIPNGQNKTAYEVALDKKNQDIIEMFDPKYQNFLHQQTPIAYDYGVKKTGYQFQIGKNAGAKKNIKSAFEVDDGRDNKDEPKKGRKIWKPKPKSETKDNDNDNDNDTDIDDGDITDEELVEPEPVKKKNKAEMMFGVSTRTLTKPENDVTDILSTLGLEQVNESESNDDDDDDDDDNEELKTQVTDVTDADIDNDVDSDSDSVSVSSRSMTAPSMSRARSRGKSAAKKKRASQRVLDLNNKIEQERLELPKLGNWMEKRRNKPPKMYQKRFACVIDGHLLWNDKKVNVRPGSRMDNTERKKFAGSVSLMMIKNVSIHDSKKKNTWKFKITLRQNAKVSATKGKKLKIKDKSERVYLWKTYSKETRDIWVDGLKKHVKHLKKTLKNLESLHH